MRTIVPQSGQRPQARPRRRTPETRAKALATTLERGTHLLEDGYRMRLAEGTPGLILVWHPERHQEPYHVQVWYDTAGQIWRYLCDCPICHAEHQCKHGRQVILLLEPASRFVAHCVCGERPVEAPDAPPSLAQTVTRSRASVEALNETGELPGEEPGEFMAPIVPARCELCQVRLGAADLTYIGGRGYVYRRWCGVCRVPAVPLGADERESRPSVPEPAPSQGRRIAALAAAAVGALAGNIVGFLIASRLGAL